MNRMTERPQLLGRSPEFTALLRSLQVASATDVTVMLLGESGTGKEQLARYVHENSARSKAPFVAINCAALPDGLAESELFGHRKGAFTGAVSDNCGRIGAAQGGTLFLDEVGEMSAGIQAKLLRFLESGEYQPVGSVTTQQADVRIVAATHADLLARVEEGHFRQDLYYRLNIVPFQVPPLRERTGDLELLTLELTAQASRNHGLEPPTYSTEALELMKQHHWPGNVRELRNLCERLLILFPGKTIEAGNLPPEIRARERRKWRFSIPDSGLRLEELEQELLLQALEKTGGNQSRAARLLGLSRYAFIYRLKKYALT
jgi:DNA-binding NtrC family response regulator